MVMSQSLNISAKLKGSRFGSDEEIKAMVVQWFQQQHTEFFAEGIHWLATPSKEQSLNGFQLNKLHN
jgi:hypothetical protein